MHLLWPGTSFKSATPVVSRGFLPTGRASQLDRYNIYLISPKTRSLLHWRIGSLIVLNCLQILRASDGTFFCIHNVQANMPHNWWRHSDVSGLLTVVCYCCCLFSYMPMWSQEYHFVNKMPQTHIVSVSATRTSYSVLFCLEQSCFYFFFKTPHS